MVMELTGLAEVATPLRDAVRRYAELIQELAGDNTLSLTLFGAAAAGRFDATRHTIRNVLVLRTVNLAMLRRLSEHGARLGKDRISAPLVMTPEYIRQSLDTFPLELIEIKQCHVAVFGDDYFDSLDFEDGHVRLQCERELKVILIGLRQGLLAAAGRATMVEALETDAAGGLVRTMRGLLWLKGQREGRPAEEVVAGVEKIIEGKLPGVRASLDAGGEHDWDEFQSLYADVETLGKVVDAW